MAYQKIGFKNGNVLTAEQLIHMEDGIVAAEKKAGTGGTGLPSDVGAYKYMATDGSGEWQAVDRLAWKEVAQEETVPYASVDFTPQEGIYVGTSDALSAYVFNVGEKVKFLFDGEVFERYVMELQGTPYVGNAGIIGETVDSGEDWLFADLSKTGVGKAVITTRSGESHEVGVVNLAETIHSLPTEYLNYVVIKNGDYDNALSGIATVGAEETSFTSVGISFDEAVNIVMSGKMLMCQALTLDASGYPASIPAEIHYNYATNKFYIAFEDNVSQSTNKYRWMPTGEILAGLD